MWSFIKIVDELKGCRKNYVVRTSCTETTHTIFLCDLIRCWTEKISLELLLERCQSLNPLLEASPDQLTEHVMSLLNSKRNDIERRLVLREDMCILSLKSRLVGLPFVFEFHLEQASGELLYAQVTAPVLIALLELHERQNRLTKIIKKKDAEIEEYKINGAQLSRRNIETPVFDELEFAKKCLESPFSPEVVSDPRECIFTPSMQSLIMDVFQKIDRTASAEESTILNDMNNTTREEVGHGTVSVVSIVATTEGHATANTISSDANTELSKDQALSPGKAKKAKAVGGCASGLLGCQINAQVLPPKKQKYSPKKKLGL